MEDLRVIGQARSSDHLAAVSSKPRFNVAMFMPCEYYASANLLRADDDLAEISRPIDESFCPAIRRITPAMLSAP
ncbi:MAG TPA: hypothetical protein VF775_01305 [Geobacteraceae bacterium]